MKRYLLKSFILISLALVCNCSDKSDNTTENVILYPQCGKATQTKVDAHTPETVAADWSAPIKVGDAINTFCPEDAIEISGDGQYLYFLFTTDVLDSLTPEEMLKQSNNTYKAKRTGDPGQFGQPVFYDLGKGANGSLDGELSFSPDSTKVYFHSNRASNLGYNHDPFMNDFLDIYVADIINGVPGPGRNLGSPPNSIYPDGEHAIHPDGVTLYFASSRPAGHGKSDLYTSTFDGTDWSEPVNMGTTINSAGDDKQPAFTPDGDTMYYCSERNILIGPAIYRSVFEDGNWTTPELVIRGIVGEPSLTADGQLLYFVHVLTEGSVTFDADIYYCERVK